MAGMPWHEWLIQLAALQVVKIDVEGFEMDVLKGAEGLLSKKNVWFMMTECNVNIIKEAGRNQYLK